MAHSPASEFCSDGESFSRVATEYIVSSTKHMHGVSSRTDPRIVASEVERLNTAVRANVERISPYAQPADYQRELLLSEDESNRASWLNLSPTLDRVSTQAGGYLTLAAAARRLAAGEITSEQLTEQALARAVACQPTTNAFIEIWADRAMEQARAADVSRASGKVVSPLNGIPLAHKDCFEIQGYAATIGSRARPAVVALHNGRAIQKLNDLGAVTLGVLNMNEMVAGPTGQNPIFGDCCNALDPARISGGSSSGSGSAVASGVVFASLGSDTGGSIRIPASVQGLFGLKPTYGRISREGCFPRAFSLDCPGPLARTAEDCALLLEAVAGYDEQEPSTLNAAVPLYSALLDSAAEHSRVAVMRLPAQDASRPEIASVFDDFVSRVARTFGSVREVDFPQLSTCYAMGDILSKVEAATLHAQWMRTRPEAYSQAVYSRTEPGLHVPAARYLEALMVRATILREFLAGTMGEADILLCPTIPVPVPLRVDADMEKKGSVFNVVTEITRLTRPFSYLGLPVLSMPIGTDLNGMPVGAQVIGKPLAEARLLSFAHQMS